MKNFPLFFAILFPLMLFSGSAKAQQSDFEKRKETYFGLNAGYSYQQKEIGGSATTPSGLNISNFKIKDSGFFIAPRIGIPIGNGFSFLEIEPRWTVASYKISAKVSNRAGNSINVEVEGETFHHILFPVMAVTKQKTDSAEFLLGIGEGIQIYDVGNDIDRRVLFPTIAKAGVAFSVSERIKIGGEIVGSFALDWRNSARSIDIFWGISAGGKIECRF